MSFIGDRDVGATIVFDFDTTVAGAPTTLSGTPALRVYKNSTTESAAGITLSADYDSRTGFNHVVIDTTADPSFYATGNYFTVMISTGTVGGVSVVGRIVGSFTIGLAASVSALNAAIAAAVVDIEAAVDGIADADTLAAAVLTALETRSALASAILSSASSDVDIANLAYDLLKEANIDSFADATPEADWMARNYEPARDAELYEHPWKFALKRKKLYPLDFACAGLTGTLSGAWGVVRLTENYSGDLIRIRRSSDSTTDDFTWAEASLDVDTDAIGTFVGTGKGYIDRLYDQTGNGRHLLQATTTKQPEFSDGLTDEDGVSIANGKPGIIFDGTDDILATSGALSDLISTATGYIVVVGLIDALTLDSATPSSNHLLLGDASSKTGLYARLGGTLYGMNDDGSADNTTDAVPVGIPFVAELRHASGTLYSRVNGAGEEEVTSGTTSSLAGALNIGDLAGGSHPLDFNLFAVLTFSAAPTEAERDRLVSRLMRYFGAAGQEDFGWVYRYPLPEDCIRMLQLRYGGYFEGGIVQHEIEDGYILTNQAPPLYSRYVRRFTDASKFNPLFKLALAANLAARAAHFITGKASYAQTVMGHYKDILARAKRANALEATPERPASDDVINARETGIEFLTGR